MILDFGKHKGRDINDLPLKYVKFLAGYTMRGTQRHESDLPASKWVTTHKSDVANFAKAFLKDKCWHCGSNLVPIGSSRANGAGHDDWKERYLHKRCWKELKTGKTPVTG